MAPAATSVCGAVAYVKCLQDYYILIGLVFHYFIKIELLQEEFRLKDDELYYEQSLRIEATARRNQMERTLAFARKQYEETLRESNRECTRLSRQFEECSQNLSVTKAQVESVKYDLLLNVCNPSCVKPEDR